MSDLPATIGGYTIEAKIGEGGMGAVYRATRATAPGRVFAIKVLRSAEDEPTQKELARFAREIKALSAATEHPNVVRILGGSADPKQPWIAMELVAGESLEKLAGGAPLEPARAARIVCDVCDAVAFVHEKGIVHRDLKPANILIEENDNPRVCDFGLARIAEADRLTRSGVILGTVAYSAPEQIEGRGHHADARADVYALGAVLYYTITGCPPFDGRSQAALIKSALQDTPPTPSSLEPAVPKELDAIVAKAMERDIEKRYQTVAALRDDLDAWLASLEKKGCGPIAALVIAAIGLVFALS
jgi:serine/threonine protein kinase